MWRKIKKIFSQRNHFILTTHVNPDGDGIGAACGLTELLLRMHKKVQFVCDSPIPSKFAFLDYKKTHRVYSPSLDLSEADTLVVLDTHKKDRIGALAKLIDQPNILSICIDHHQAENTFTPYALIDPKACSVGAMIYALYKELGFDLNLEAASGIYTSVFCDTSRFSNASTGRKAHKIADDCIKHGVDPDRMASKILQHVSLAELKMFANVLSHMETYLDNRVIIQEIRREDYSELGEEVQDIDHIDFDPFLDLNKQVENVDCVLLLREGEDGVRVSLRSKEVDIAEVMESLGGGGHRKAAGLIWKGSMEEVKQKILKRLEELLGRVINC